MLRLRTRCTISIHTPTRERRNRLEDFVESVLFQSTLPRGSDKLLTGRQTTVPLFQSTLPRGSDASRSKIKPFLKSFQSTLPRGSDDNRQTAYGGTDTFQSTLPRGSDSTVSLYFINYLYFNPHSHEGATAAAAA